MRFRDKILFKLNAVKWLNHLFHRHHDIVYRSISLSQSLHRVTLKL